MSAVASRIPQRLRLRLAHLFVLLVFGVAFWFFSDSSAAAAESQFFVFKIGNIECVSLSDGYFKGPLRAAAPEVPEEELRAFMTSNGASAEFLITPLSCLFLRLPGRNVLVDTGIGTMIPAPTAGKLQDALREAGIDPEEVDTVLLSHLHQDHVGGAFMRDGRPLFPNATYHASEEEVEFWLNPGTDLSGTLMPLSMRKMVINNARRFLLFSLGSLCTFPSGGEAIPGVDTVPLPGHTPGQVGFIFQSEGETLIYTADAGGNLFISLQKPDWRFQNDNDAQTASATRRKLWEHVIDENWHLFAPHFPRPAVGSLTEESGKIFFRPKL